MRSTSALASTSMPLVKDSIVRFLEEGGESSQFTASNQCLQGIELMNVSLQGANLSQTDLSQANLCGINLSRANLRGANLHASALCWAQLRHADLGEADLQDADLSWADLRFANLRGSRLDGAILDGADLRAADLGGSGLDQTEPIQEQDEAYSLHTLRQHLRSRGAIVHDLCTIQIVDPPGDERTSFRWGVVLGVLLMSVLSFVGILKTRSVARVQQTCRQ